MRTQTKHSQIAEAASNHAAEIAPEQIAEEGRDMALDMARTDEQLRALSESYSALTTVIESDPSAPTTPTQAHATEAGERLRKALDARAEAVAEEAVEIIKQRRLDGVRA